MDTLEIMQEAKSPQYQETFLSTEWTIGNTGKGKNHNYNDDFEMIYRVVDISQKVMDRNFFP